MMKRALAVLAVFVLGATLALAAPMKGKVTSIDGKKVQIELVGEKAAWLKKGAPVKFQGGVGRVLEIKDAVVTMNSKNADEAEGRRRDRARQGPGRPGRLLTGGAGRGQVESCPALEARLDRGRRGVQR